MSTTRLLFAFLLLAQVSFSQEPLTPTWEEFGAAENAQLGRFEPQVLDFNGDGWLDLLQYQYVAGVGNYRLLAGSAQGFTANAFVWEVPPGQFLTADGTAGDFNGDGADDLVLGDKNYNGGVGALEIYYGGTTLPTTPSLLLTSPLPGTPAAFGVHFDGSGDVNGDGFDDLVVVAPNFDDGSPFVSNGRMYCFYGSANGLTTQGIEIAPWHAGQNFARNVRHGGDVNGDGFGDMLVHTGWEGVLQEFIEIYFGSAAGILADTSITVGDGIPNEAFAYDFGKAGDVNGDGFDDFFVSIPQHDATLGVLGKMDVFYGTATGEPDDFPVFALPGLASDNWGWSVAPVGDFNGDGFDDLALRDGGRFWIYKGGTGEFDELPDFEYVLGNFNQPNVAECGDLNKDGYGDLLAYSYTVKAGDFSWLAGWQAIFSGRSETRPDFTAEPSGCLPDNVFHFQNLTTGLPATGWLWDFGDGTFSTLENPVHSYATDGWFTVKLTATNGLGQAVSIQKDSAIVVYAPLAAGEYSVGGSQADFASLTAFSRHVRCGLTGDVTLKIANGTYLDSLVLEQVPTNGFTLTIESASSERDSVLIYKTMRMAGTENVVLQNLSVYHDDDRAYSLKIENCKGVSLENCRLFSLDYFSGFLFPTQALRVSGTENLRVEDCFFDNLPSPTNPDQGFTMAGMDSCRQVIFRQNSATANFTNLSNYSPGVQFSVRNSQEVLVAENHIVLMHANFQDVTKLDFLKNHLQFGLIRVDTGSQVVLFQNEISGTEEALRLNNVKGFRVISNKIFQADGGINLKNCEGVSAGDFNLVANNAIGGDLGTQGQFTDFFQHGIGAFQSKNLKIYHNSVQYDQYAYMNSQDWGAALHLVDCDSVDVRNNVFKNTTSTGNAGGVVYLAGFTNFTSDFNAFDGTGFTHPLPNAVFGLDFHSIFTPIHFAGTFDLHLDAATPLLNQAAPALPEVPFDLEGNPRPADFVDVGAFEFSAPAARNLHAERLLNNALQVGQNQVSVQAINLRPLAEDSIFFSYQFNYQPPVTELWTGSLAGFDTLDYMFSTPLPVEKGMLMSLKTWVSLPDGAEDFPKNDSLQSWFILPMAGSYSVGGTGDDFANLEEVSRSLDSCELAGDLVFNLQPGNYGHMFSFKDPATFSDTIQRVFRRAPGSAGEVFWSQTFTLNAHNLTFEDIRFLPAGLEFYWSKNLIFRQCRFSGNGDGLACKAVFCENLSWENCQFEDFEAGIELFYFDPIIWTDAGYAAGEMKVQGCQFRGMSAAGFRCSANAMNLTVNISGNRFEESHTGILFNMAGTYFDPAFSANITDNVFSVSQRSIYLNLPSLDGQFFIANNVVADGWGMYLFNPGGTCELAHNSFLPTGILCVQAANGGQLKLFNNSFNARHQTGYLAPLIQMNGGSYEGDFNNFYHQNQALPLFEHFGSFIYQLADFQALTGQEQHSLNVPPRYASPENAHLLPGSPLVGAATPLANVALDFDGEPRDPTAPDIGADEFNACYVADALPTHLSGKITTSGGAPLANSAVYLIRFDQVTGFVSAIDTTLTDAGGNYQFTTSEPAVFLKAVPDLAAYPNQVPTYFGSSVAVQSATCLRLDSAEVTASFATLQGMNPGGAGFVSGYVSEGAGFVSVVPEADLPVFLMNEQHQPVAWAVTDAAGFFSFSNLAAGKYWVWVDKTWVSNALAPAISLEQNLEDLQFELHSYYLELLATSLPQPSLAVVSVQDALCVGSGHFGSATAQASGGTLPYNYLWDNGEGGETSIVLLPGDHSVTVTDSNGQADSATFTVGVQIVLEPVVTIENATCPTCADGKITVQGAGGTPPYIVLWNVLPFGEVQENLLPGTYAWEIIDQNGCSTKGEAVVGSPSGTAEAELPEVKIFPNPATERLEIQVKNGVLKSWRLADLLEKIVLSGAEQAANLSGLPLGVYVLEMQVGEVWVRRQVVKI